MTVNDVMKCPLIFIISKEMLVYQRKHWRSSECL